MRHIIVIGGCLFLSMVLWVACSEEKTGTDQEDTAEISSIQEGKRLFVVHCSVCHEGPVQEAPRLRTLQLLSQEAIVSALSKTGVMYNQGSALTEQEHEQIAMFISETSSPSDESTVMAGLCAEEEEMDKFGAEVSNWGLGLNNHRFVSESEINADNVSQLQLKWAFAFPHASRARVQATLAGNTLFTASQHGTIYALDRESGCIRWSFQAEAEVRSALIIGQNDKGQAHRLYFGDFNANVYALDLETRQLLWKKQVDDHPVATITGSMNLYEGRLYIPVSSTEIVSALDPGYACCTFRGSVVALNAEDGSQIWKSFSIPEEPSQHGENQNGAAHMAPSGAPVWTSPTIDPKRQMLYIGTGENYSRPASGTSDAIIAMSLKDGSIQWVRQTISEDAWNGACTIPGHANCPEDTGPDADFGAPAILLRVGERDLLIAGQKSGMVYALDPDDEGKIVWQQLVGRGGIMGGIHWGMVSDGKRLFVPINDQGSYPLHPDKAIAPGVHALDPKDGSTIWATIERDRCEQVPGETCGPGISAAITATPEVIFAGALDGVLKAYDSQTGEELWAYDTKQEYQAANGVKAFGGSIDSDGPVIVGRQLFINSGYAKFRQKAGNVLLAFELK